MGTFILVLATVLLSSMTVWSLHLSKVRVHWMLALLIATTNAVLIGTFYAVVKLTRAQ